MKQWIKPGLLSLRKHTPFLNKEIYGEVVQKAISYILDDQEAFLKILKDVNLHIHNIAIECCLHHIAIDSRNRLHTETLRRSEYTFMFGLLESCKLNDINFGAYIEDILTRIVHKEPFDESFFTLF